MYISWCVLYVHTHGDVYIIYIHGDVLYVHTHGDVHIIYISW